MDRRYTKEENRYVSVLQSNQSLLNLPNNSAPPFGAYLVRVNLNVKHYAMGPSHFFKDLAE